MNESTVQPGPARLYLLYHELRREPTSYSYAMDLSRFEQQVALFARRHEDIRLGPLPEITFDDGHCSDRELAMPVLDRYGLKAHFFITAGWTGTPSRYMDWPQIRELHRNGHHVGAHGWSHRLLTQCSPAELDQELDRPRKLIEDRLGESVDRLSLPGGRYNRRVLDRCQEAGYAHIYTSHPRLEPNPDAAVIGRLNLRGDTTLDWLTNLLAPDGRLLQRIMRRHRVKQAGKSLLGDALYARLWRIANRAEPTGDDTSPFGGAELP